jgi:hypothetical protein
MSAEKYIVFNPEGGLGKIIASTAVVKKIRATYPEHKIVVMTPWPEVYLNNPNVYRVYRSGNTPYFYKDFLEGKDTIVFKGEPYFNTGHLYSRQHLIKSWCELHNIEFDGDVTPELKFTLAEVESYRHMFQRDKPILIMQTNGGPFNLEKSYSWTRDFPINQAQVLVNELSKKYHIIHVTRQKAPQLNGVERIVEVNKRLLMLMLLFSQKRLLIDSCLQHAAAAMGLPSTVCWVGTSPDVFGYDIHTNVKPVLKPFNTNTMGIDSIFFDYNFDGPEHEFPYPSYDLFDVQSIYDTLI